MKNNLIGIICGILGGTLFFGHFILIAWNATQSSLEKVEK